MDHLLSSVWAVVGLLISGGLFTVAWQMYESRKRDRERLIADARHRDEVERAFDFDSYKSIDSKYYDYLKLVLQYPELGCSQYSEPATNLSPIDEARRNTIIEMHFSVFETAYIGRNISVENSERRWPAWDQYIKAHLVRADYQSLWKRWRHGPINPGSSGFDRDFEKYVNDCLSQISLSSTDAEPLAKPIRKS